MKTLTVAKATGSSIRSTYRLNGVKITKKECQSICKDNDIDFTMSKYNTNVFSSNYFIYSFTVK